MGAFESTQNLACVLKDWFGIERGSGDGGRKRLAFEELHSENRRLLFQMKVENGADVGVLEAGRQHGLTLEFVASVEPHVEQRDWQENLERYFAVETVVNCAVDLAHTALSHAAYDSVPAQNDVTSIPEELSRAAVQTGAKLTAQDRIRGAAPQFKQGSGLSRLDGSIAYKLPAIYGIKIKSDMEQFLEPIPCLAVGRRH